MIRDNHGLKKDLTVDKMHNHVRISHCIINTAGTCVETKDGND